MFSADLDCVGRMGIVRSVCGSMHVPGFADRKPWISSRLLLHEKAPVDENEPNNTTARQQMETWIDQNRSLGELHAQPQTPRHTTHTHTPRTHAPDLTPPLDPGVPAVCPCVLQPADVH